MSEPDCACIANKSRHCTSSCIVDALMSMMEPSDFTMWTDIFLEDAISKSSIPEEWMSSATTWIDIFPSWMSRPPMYNYSNVSLLMLVNAGVWAHHTQGAMCITSHIRLINCILLHVFFITMSREGRSVSRVSLWLEYNIFPDLRSLS